MNIVVYMGSL